MDSVVGCFLSGSVSLAISGRNVFNANASITIFILTSPPAYGPWVVITLHATNVSKH